MYRQAILAVLAAVFPVAWCDDGPAITPGELPVESPSSVPRWIARDNAAAPPTSVIPNPDCVGDSPPDGSRFVYEAEGISAINRFCGQKLYWDQRIVSPVSMINDPNSVPSIEDSYSFNNSLDNLWLQIAFSEGSCVGTFKFTEGTDDASKLKHCVDRFSKILDGCNTGPPDKKYGGNLTDVCAFYRMKVVSIDDPNPLTLKANGDLGALKCRDTDTSAIAGPDSVIAGTCTCWYEALPGNEAVFNKPTGGTCDDIKGPTSTSFQTPTWIPTKLSPREPAPVVKTAAPGEGEVKARATRKWLA